MKENMIGKSLQYFDFIKIIGEGAWAVVYLGINSNNGQQVAIKTIPKMKIKQVPKLEELIKTEIKVLKTCKNENVIGFVDTFTSDKSIFIVTQFCNGGDLEEYLIKKKTLTEDQATMFLKQILNGFRGLHQVGAMHRDFKLANVLLHNGKCKIADLGFAKQMVQNMTRTVLGTSLTMAPQVLDQKPYGKQADIWSIAVVYYQMIFGKYPYNGKSDFDILKKIKNSRPDMNSMQITDNCRDFIDKCLTVDPKKRISWVQIYAHPLICQKKNGFLYGNDINNERINQNKNFYKNKKPQQNKQFLYPQLQNEYDISDIIFQEANNIRETINYENKLKIAQQLKQMQKRFNFYQKQYYMRRNDIMFAFKYIAPYIYSLAQIKANHQISLFIISKKAYLQMSQFLRLIKDKQNLFKFNQFWEQFANSKQYQQLENQFRTDLEVILNQCYIYREDMKIYNKRIQAQYNIQKPGPGDFLDLVKQTVQDYWFLLAQKLGEVNGKRKEDLIKVLLGLEYYKSNSKACVQEFDRMMAQINLRQSEDKIKAKIQSIYN